MATALSADAIVLRELPVAPSFKEDVGSLLRLFKSQFFDAHLAISYLHKYQSKGIWDYLCNQLYSLPPRDVEFYLPQLCNLAVHQKVDTDSLEKLLLDLASRSMHVALKAAWLFQAYIEDDNATVNTRCLRLREDVEVATVNGRRIERGGVARAHNSSPQLLLSRSSGPSSAASVSSLSQPSPSSTTPLTISVTTTRTSVSAGSALDPTSILSPRVVTAAATIDAHTLIRPSQDIVSSLPAPVDNSEHESDVPLLDDDVLLRMFSLKKAERSEMFDRIQWFIEELGNISDRLRAVAIPQRQQRLEEEIATLNSSGRILGVYLPIYTIDGPHHALLSVPASEVRVLNSRDRVPFLLVLEVVETAQSLFDDHHSVPDPFVAAGVDAAVQRELHALVRKVVELERRLGRTTPTPSPSSSPAGSSGDLLLMHHRSSSVDTRASAAVAASSATSPTASLANAAEAAASSSSSLSSAPPPSSATALSSSASATHQRKLSESRLKALTAELPPVIARGGAFGESADERALRLREKSKYGKLPRWSLITLIVKYGDELRQDQLSVQLIAIFAQIFRDAHLPLYLRPYRIMETSSRSGLIECVPNVRSIHQLRKADAQFTSLLHFFKKTFGPPISDEFLVAHHNFIESVAGYSLVCYFLQIKDRHNGNIMLDSAGHLIHIDFGFMLGNSPGNVNFESAPFKLTSEMVDVMGGQGSDGYRYFQALMIRGFLEVRKHMERIVTLVEMMSVGVRLPCLAAGPVVVESLRERFHMSATEEEAVELVESLIYQSLDNWRTVHYDHYQYLTNGILY